MPRSALATTIAAAGLLTACVSPRRPADAMPAAVPHPAAEHALHNILPVIAGLISGSVPDSSRAFDELAAMGVKTIISVDGAPPDAASARARGIRTIHIPVGYHGISADRQLALARAVRDADGPVYLHCHHGRHRGPAAAASAAILLGRMTPEEGVAFLKHAGSSADYPGLYRCVAGAATASDADLDAVQADFPEVAPMPGFVLAMAEAQERFDHLAQIRDAGWRVPPSHPDLVPAAEAARLETLMRSLLDDPRVREEQTGFGVLLAASARAAREFEDALAARDPDAALAARLRAVHVSCRASHARHRDVR